MYGVEGVNLFAIALRDGLIHPIIEGFTYIISDVDNSGGLNQFFLTKVLIYFSKDYTGLTVKAYCCSLQVNSNNKRCAK